MILIDDILISDEILSEKFACDLSKCKGACCVEGDYGAPLEEEEISLISKLLPQIIPHLDSEAQEVISTKGFHQKNVESGKPETTLVSSGACVFMGRHETGITYCTIEKEFLADNIAYRKPISCHLYPIRVSRNPQTGFTALNYDRWDICKAACDKGQKIKMKVFEFVKEGLIRAFGVDFYEKLSGYEAQSRP